MRRLVVAVVLVSAVLMTFAGPQAALGGTPGRWDRITPTNQTNIDQFALHRTSDDRLHVLWVRHGDGLDEDLVHRSIGPGGAVGDTHTVVSGWSTMGDPAVIADGSGLRAFFGGLRSTDSSETYTDLATATAPMAGTPWTLAGELAAEGDSAYAGNVAATIGPDGTPFQAWDGAGVFVHKGLTPSTNYGYQARVGGGCCSYSPNLAVDGATDRMWIAFYSNDRDGVWVNEVNTASGAPVGSARRMPGSCTNFNGTCESSQIISRTPMTGRGTRAGVYVAYTGGYPTPNKVLVWKIGASSSQVVGRGTTSGSYVAIAPAPDGRLWVLWTRDNTRGRPRVYARRSNPTATTWGETVSVPSPSGSTFTYKIAADAQTDVVDVIATFNSGTGSSIAGWHTQIRPGLSLTATPTRFEGRRTVTFRVRDAGAPVRGAVVKAGTKSTQTNADGEATLTFGPYSSRTRIPVVATKSGYVRDRIVLVARPS